jgi:hypothetical protein
LIILLDSFVLYIVLAVSGSAVFSFVGIGGIEALGSDESRVILGILKET